MARCTGHTKAGNRCKLNARSGTTLCPAHSEDPPETGKAAGGGRPTAITDPDTLERLRRGFLTSGTDYGAAREARIHPNTLSAWRTQGRADLAEGKHDTEHARVESTLTDAKSELIAELGAQAQAIAIRDQDFRSIMRLLAVLDPDNYSETKRVRHGGDAGAPPIATTNLPPVQIVSVQLDAGLQAESAAILNDTGL